MNKNLLIGLAIVALVVLGYFALQDNKSNDVSSPEMAPHGMEQMPGADQMSEGGLEIVDESAKIPFNETYSIDKEWSIVINQFEPNAKIVDAGMIMSDSDEELNPAVKVDFFKDGELIHYQIVFKEMPGFHSVKPGQKYLLDFIDYKGFKIKSDKIYSIDSANLKIWRIK